MSTTAGTCPNGHASGDAEWCDTCGAPMAGSSAASAAAATPATPPASMANTDPSGPAIAPVSCPHCGSMNAADNLFCESCGYDFTTGQVPEPVAGSTVAAPEPSCASGSSDPAADPAGGQTPMTTAPGWVVIVEVDPVWHAIKGELADRPLPDPSTSTVPLFQHVSLIGRTSQSRGLRPEVALDTDTAVSRRHAQLLVEGDKLSVVDLSSTNGTYVIDQGQVPTEDAIPLASGVPAVLDDGDQIFVGAWSRLTVRRT